MVDKDSPGRCWNPVPDRNPEPDAEAGESTGMGELAVAVASARACRRALTSEGSFPRRPASFVNLGTNLFKNQLPLHGVSDRPTQRLNCVSHLLVQQIGTDYLSRTGLQPAETKGTPPSFPCQEKHSSRVSDIAFII